MQIMLILLSSQLYLIGSVAGSPCSKKNCHNCHTVVQYKKGPPPLIQKCSMLISAQNCCSSYFMSDHMAFSQSCKPGCICEGMTLKDSPSIPVDVALSELDEFRQMGELNLPSSEEICDPIVDKSAYNITIMALLGVLTSFFAVISYGFYKRNSMNPASGKLRQVKKKKSCDVKSSLTATAIHAAMTSSTIADMSGEPQKKVASDSKEDDEFVQVTSHVNNRSHHSTATNS